MHKTRLEAFSDGVIAIIITIMVLELKVPHDTEWTTLLSLWPIFASYIMSFIYVGIYWGNHHHTIHTVKKINGKIIWANNHLLFWLSLIPFTTAWMGENHFAQNTVILYGINLICCAFAYTILQKTITHLQQYTSELNEAIDKQKQKGIISIVLYASGIILAFLNPVFSAILYVTVAILWLLPDRNIEKAMKE